MTQSLISSFGAAKFAVRGVFSPLHLKPFRGQSLQLIFLVSGDEYLFCPLENIKQVVTSAHDWMHIDQVLFEFNEKASPNTISFFWQLWNEFQIPFKPPARVVFGAEVAPFEGLKQLQTAQYVYAGIKKWRELDTTLLLGDAVPTLSLDQSDFAFYREVKSQVLKDWEMFPEIVKQLRQLPLGESLEKKITNIIDQR